jgi:predicted O-methyltransferase YrrM
MVSFGYGGDSAAMNCRQDLNALLRRTANQEADRFTLWETIINALKPETVLELGVWKGDFAIHILTHCPSIKRYYMIDPWRSLPAWNKPFNVESAAFEEAYKVAMNATRFAADKLVVLRGTTTEVIDKIPNQSLDFAYIDGDHTLRGITIDLANVLGKVRADGYLAGDDFLPSIWEHSAKYEPTLIFPFALYFAEAHRIPIYALPHGQFLIHKNSEIGYSFTDLVGAYGKQDVLQHVSLRRLIRRYGRQILTGR